MESKKGIVKLYYTIKEVATRFSVSESALRAWEREFPNLNPKRNNSGDRKYKEDDIKQIELIIELRKTKKLTVAGAKDYIKAKNHKKVENEDLLIKLKKIKSFLVDLRDNLDAGSENIENQDEKTILQNEHKDLQDHFEKSETQDDIEALNFENTLEIEANRENNNVNEAEIANAESINLDLETKESESNEQLFTEEIFEENILENESKEISEEENIGFIKPKEVKENINLDKPPGGYQASLF